MNDLNLLMVHADDHAPMLDAVSEASVHAPRAESALPDHLWDEGGDPNDLHAQRWGVIAPEGPRGDRLLALVAPLIARRREQQGGEPVRIYRVPERMRASEAAIWKKSVFRTQQELDIDLPRYQLILGDLHEVPLSIQQMQGSDGFVGRLAFDRDEDYAAYADKVLRWESNPAPHTAGRAVFHTVQDGTSATRLGQRALVTPGVALLRERLERGQLNADQIVENRPFGGPNPAELAEAVRTDRPAMLLSLSHGEGPPRAGWASAEAQRAGQGAMSFGSAGRLRGEDLRDAAFLPGGVWFMLACFGAGSPEASAYAHWLRELASLDSFRGAIGEVLEGIPRERPFIAGIPKAVLASANGPLGFYGHIDLAWSYSFQDLDQGPIARPARFMGVVRSVLKRDRLGIGFRELFRTFEQVNTELSVLQDEQAQKGVAPDAAARTRQAQLWMLRQDLGAYVLLGDPAARLPLADRSAPPPPAPTPVLAEPPPTLPIGIDELEEAIAKLTLGEASPKEIAAEYGIDRADLRRLAEIYQRAGRKALGAE